MNFEIRWIDWAKREDALPYHVRITTHSNRTRDEIRLDLTREQVVSRFVEPYRQGRPIVIGGRTIPIEDIERLRINFTQENSDALLPQIRAERRSSRAITPIPDDWYVTAHGQDMTDELIDVPAGTDERIALAGTGRTTDPRMVFVVHGRNVEIRDSMFAFLRSIGLHPIEWNEALNSTGRATPYIGEVLETAFTMAQAVVVVLTPDDEARLLPQFRLPGDPPHEVNLTPQARPNVLFEAGMAFAYRPDHTVLVQVGEVRPFSDVGGRHVLRLSNSTQSRQGLATRLQAAGCAVNITGTDWHTTGNFSVEGPTA